MKKYTERLGTEGSKRVDAIGRAKLHLRLGEINTDVEALVMHDLDNHMILGLETLKGRRFIIDLDTDQLYPSRSAISPFWAVAHFSFFYGAPSSREQPKTSI